MLDFLTKDDIGVGIFVVMVVLVLLAGIVEVHVLFIEEDGCVIDESLSFETASDAALACRRVVAIGKALSAHSDSYRCIQILAERDSTP